MVLNNNQRQVVNKINLIHLTTIKEKHYLESRFENKGYLKVLLFCKKDMTG